MLWNDVTYAIRMMRRTPLFTVAVAWKRHFGTATTSVSFVDALEQRPDSARIRKGPSTRRGHRRPGARTVQWGYAGKLVASVAEPRRYYAEVSQHAASTSV